MTIKPRIVKTIWEEFALLVDDTTTANVTYICKAEPGSATSDAVWQISIVDETGAHLRTKWADGNKKFDNIADNRDTLSYS